MDAAAIIPGLSVDDFGMISWFTDASTAHFSAHSGGLFLSNH
jgi:hypothetical protein